MQEVMSHVLIWLSVSGGIQLRSTPLWLEVPISTLGAGRLLCRDNNPSVKAAATRQPGPSLLNLWPSEGPGTTSALTKASQFTQLDFYLSGLQQLMKTDDDEQSQTRQEDIHEDPEKMKQMQMNQDDSSQTGEEEGGRRLDARLSIQAVFFLCDGHRLVEDRVLEQVPLDKKDRRGHEAGRHHLSIQCSPHTHTRALTALSL